jgi:hypothetical protein
MEIFIFFALTGVLFILAFLYRRIKKRKAAEKETRDLKAKVDKLKIELTKDFINFLKHMLRKRKFVTPKFYDRDFC